jgi:hypothetical protein
LKRQWRNRAGRPSSQEPRGIRPRGFLLCGGAGVPVWLPAEGMVMAMDGEPSRSDTKIIRLVGRDGLPKWGAGASIRASLVLLSIVIFIGFVTWGTRSRPSDAGSGAAPLPAKVTQNASQPDPAGTLTQAMVVAPTEQAAAPIEAAPVDGLRMSSQSWRRGGLGSNAQVTFTLRNGNDYAVGDIEISCAFSRRDGSHLTDRTRTIHDTVNMKSRRTFAHLHVGFVNINANKAKCSLIAANRI